MLHASGLWSWMKSGCPTHPVFGCVDRESPGAPTNLLSAGSIVLLAAPLSTSPPRPPPAHDTSASVPRWALSPATLDTTSPGPRYSRATAPSSGTGRHSPASARHGLIEPLVRIVIQHLRPEIRIVSRRIPVRPDMQKVARPIPRRHRPANTIASVSSAAFSNTSGILQRCAGRQRVPLHIQLRRGQQLRHAGIPG